MLFKTLKIVFYWLVPLNENQGYCFSRKRFLSSHLKHGSSCVMFETFEAMSPTIK